MPLYEYRCTSCGEHLEALQHLDEPRLVECPNCGGKLERLISAPALQFKGSGWYVTDYARSGGRGANESARAKEGDGSAAKSDETKSDATPAASESKATKAESTPVKAAANH
ncbi:MAG: FmdB family zinc ribbon protein [Acidobacteriota bacterium]